MSAHRPYLRLAAMTALAFAAMFVLMYAMVATVRDVYPNFNQVYMAALMAASMVPIELALMRAMYPNGRVNRAVLVASIAVLAGAFLLIRGQVAIGDGEFLRSMIPHHSSAILMCREAPIQDAQILDLCARIIAGQQAEIDEMRAILARLNNGPGG